MLMIAFNRFYFHLHFQVYCFMLKIQLDMNKYIVLVIFVIVPKKLVQQAILRDLGQAKLKQVGNMHSCFTDNSIILDMGMLLFEV